MIRTTSSVLTSSIKTPLPYQKVALVETLGGLKKYDRVKVIMACGSGKTLLQLWTAERRRAKTVIVFVPSLALVRQTLGEWRTETTWKRPSYICVCSDKGVGKAHEDDIVATEEEVGCPVTNEPSEIRQFLRSKTRGPKIIFCTYHSADVVADGMPKAMSFDLGIFDEAHVTAGSRDGMFGFALQDRNLRIKKRTFWTATPRHYKAGKRKRDDDTDDQTLVYSMDDPAVYGPTVHTLSFRRAVELDVICDYRVLISVVTNRMLECYHLNEGHVLINGQRVPAKVVAHAIALRQGVRRYGIRKIFSFHPSVVEAREFCNGGAQSVVHHLSRDFGVFHVSGYMPMDERETQMVGFRSAMRAIASSARALGTGVNVADADAVFFSAKKKGVIDIVQPSGRAMRKAPGKKRGYIIIPLYVELEKGEKLEDSLARTDFGTVWAVLNAMREQDEAMAEFFRRIRERRGKDEPETPEEEEIPVLMSDDDDEDAGPLDDDDQTPVTIVSGPNVDIRTLRRSITTICLDALTSNWDEMFGKLQAYKGRFGDCDVPTFWEPDQGLSSWVHKQRTNYNINQLSPERIARLDAIGFVWDSMDFQWAKMLEKLKAFKDANGHCVVVHGKRDTGDLVSWVVRQRVNRRNNQLSPERIARLDAIGFVWEPHGNAWDQMYDKLKAFKDANGHCVVPTSDAKLNAWIRRQRQAYKAKSISPDRIDRLASIGFVWKPSRGGRHYRK